MRLQLKVTNVTTEHRKWPKRGQTSIQKPFGQKKPWPKVKALEALEEGPPSGPYFLVILKAKHQINTPADFPITF